MAAKALPSPEVLRQLLRYEPDTGKLFWLPRGPEWFRSENPRARGQVKVWNARYAGRPALEALSQGYRVGRLFDVLVRAHRVIWAMTTGAWPEGEIDHINGDRADNRMENLREVSSGENGRNKGLRADNTSGQVGVSWSRLEGKWKVLIWRNGKPYSRGTFTNFVDAVRSRKAAEAEFGFHENHGRKRTG